VQANHRLDLLHQFQASACSAAAEADRALATKPSKLREDRRYQQAPAVFWHDALPAEHSMSTFAAVALSLSSVSVLERDHQQLLGNAAAAANIHTLRLCDETPVRDVAMHYSCELVCDD
jgi:hypothetical protein